MFHENVVDGGGGGRSVPDWPIYTAPAHTELLQFHIISKAESFLLRVTCRITVAQCKQQPNPASKSLRSDAIRYSVNGALTGSFFLDHLETCSVYLDEKAEIRLGAGRRERGRGNANTSSVPIHDAGFAGGKTF